jgi:hypothetical protein
MSITPLGWWPVLCCGGGSPEEEEMGVSENALLARARGYLLRRGAVLAAFTLLMTLLCASAAWAETFTVTNLNAAGVGSLRAAIDKANSNPGADEVTFAPGVSGTIALNGTLLPAATDPDVVIIRRPDNTFVAVFSAQGATWEGITEAAREDYAALVTEIAKVGWE